MIRVTILWSNWSGFTDACVRALVEEHGCAVTIGYIPPVSESPYAPDQFFRYDCTVVAVDPMRGPLPDAIVGQTPDILVVCSWNMPAYKQYAAGLAGRCVRIVAMDNQWLGTLRQHLGILASPFYIRPSYDLAFVAGRRQTEFARRLGFGPGKIYEGHCACDYGPFAARYDERTQRPLSRTFMFVGRLVPEKGIDTLLDAWAAFVAGGGDWTLKIVGAGDYARRLPPRVERIGFVQPSDLPRMLLNADVFVLPSHWEPWALVIQEAAATGMPIVCTDACGAGDVFVENGANGFIVRAGSEPDLLAALRTFASLDDDRLRAMGAKSAKLATQRTPSTWADTVIAMAGGMK